MKFRNSVKIISVLICTVLWQNSAQAYHFGTAWDESDSNGKPSDALYLDDEKDRGLNARNLYLRWNLFESTGDNQWDTGYINQKKAELRRYRDHGFDVILRINFFPVPEWYFQTYPNARFKNQYEVEWKPEVHGLDKDEIDTSAASIWHNPSTNPYQNQFDEYLSQIVTELGTDFHAVYLSAGQYGEVSYPVHVLDANDEGRSAIHRTEDFQGNNNCYWAYDTNARISLAAAYAGDARLQEILDFKPALPGTKDPFAGERITNGGFEDNYYLTMFTGPAQAISGWRTSTLVAIDQPGSWQLTIATIGSNTGAQHLQLGSPGGNQYYLHQEVKVVANRSYTLQAYVKGSGANTAAIRLRQVDETGTILNETVLDSIATTWTQVSRNITMHSNVVKAYVDIYISSGSGTIEIDALSLDDGQGTDHYAAEKYLAWYHQSLVDYINWLIPVVRGKFANSKLFLMEGGYAALAGDIEQEVQDDLMATSKNNYWVRRGLVPDRYLAGITPANRANLYFLNTAMQLDQRAYGEIAWETSALYTDYSPPHYFAMLADKYSLGKYGENAGKDWYVGMQAAFKNMAEYGYEGLAWYTAGYLFEPCNNYADIKQYADKIAEYNLLPAKSTTGTSAAPLVTGWEGDTEPRGYDNIYEAKSNVETYAEEEYAFPLSTRAYSGNKGVPAFTDNQYLVVAGHATANSAYCYSWLFNDVLISYHNIKIEPGMKLRYRIYHLEGDKIGDGNRCVGIDFMHTAEGADPNVPENRAYFRDSGLEDQAGVPVHPDARHVTANPANTWNDVAVDLSSLQDRIIHQVFVVFDDKNTSSHGTYYRAYIDDLRFGDPSAGYEEHFTGPANEIPAGWIERSSNVTLRRDGITHAQTKLVNATFGDVEGPLVADYDDTQYDAIEFKITNMTAGAYFDFGLQQHREGREYLYTDRFSHLDVPGTYRVRFSAIATTADVSSISTIFWFNGQTGHTADLDYIKLVQHPPVPVATLSPQGWVEEFDGAVNETPVGWRDRKAWGEYNARIEQNGNGQAVITLGNLNTYGDVVSPVIMNLNATVFNAVEIKLEDISEKTHLDIGLQEEGGQQRYFSLFSGLSQGGVQRAYLADIQGNPDYSGFSIKVWINGQTGSCTKIDYLRICESGAQGFSDHFTGPADEVPVGWNVINNASFTNDGSTLARLTLQNATNSVGTVQSSVIRNLDLDIYNTLEINVHSVGPSFYAVYVTMIEENGGMWSGPGIYGPGTKHIRINDQHHIDRGYMDPRAFSVRVDLLAYEAGDYVNIDSVRIIREDQVSTPTITTFTPTFTFTATPTTTMTATPTITPTPLTPQKLFAWPESGIIMYPDKAQSVLAVSKYAGVCQPNIRVHYEVVRGSGMFGDFQETYTSTGPAGERASVIFTASSQVWYLNIIRVDNQGLGYGFQGRCYIPIVVIPEQCSGAGADGSTESTVENVSYPTEEEARTAGEEILNGEMQAAGVIDPPPETFTSTPTVTPTNTPTVTVTWTPTPTKEAATATCTSTPTMTPTTMPWLKPEKVLAYPQPAKGSVIFAYNIAGQVKVVIDIYCVTGERIAHIEEHKDGGTGQTLRTQWDALDIAPGIYICRIVIRNPGGKVILNRNKKVALIQ